MKYPIMILILLLSTARAQDEPEFGRFGFGIKAGECAVYLGAQASYNFSPQIQLAAGVGGVQSGTIMIDFNRPRVESYFLLAKYYHKHVYLASGYNAIVSSTHGFDSSWVHHVSWNTSHAIPLHLGYEFGDRKGFFTALSVGFIWVPVGGGKPLRKEYASRFGDFTKAKGAESQATAGVSIGYYLF